MDRRLSLGLAIACAALAVGAVALDLQFNVNVSLESMQDGEWVVVATDAEDGYGRARTGIGCAGPEMRVVIDNGLPWATEVDVVATVFLLGEIVLVDESVSVPSGGRETIAFTVPPEAFQNQTDGPKTFAYVNVIANDRYLSACVEADA